MNIFSFANKSIIRITEQNKLQKIMQKRLEL